MRFVSTRTHSMVGIVVAIALILAPHIFGFNDVGGAAVAVPKIIGIILLLSELMTDNGFSLAKIIPMRVHLMMDYLAGAVLAASPWLFGFSDEESNAWVPHLVVGLLVIGYAAVTKYVPDNAGNGTNTA